MLFSRFNYICLPVYPYMYLAYITAANKGLLRVSFILITTLGGFVIMSFPVVLQLIKNKMQIRKE